MGVASCSLGNCGRPGGIGASDGISGGAAELLTGRWFGDAGIASPNRGPLPGV